MGLHKTSDKEFIQIVKDSISIKECIQKLNLSSSGNNYNVFHRRVKKLNLNISHFYLIAWNKNKKVGSKRILDDYLSNKIRVNSHKLRLMLLEAKIFLPECNICKLTEWMGKLIPLELDHINGNHYDNSLANLRILCSNCHSQTETNCKRKKKS